MSTAVNNAGMGTGGTEFDEETWLVEPPCSEEKNSGSQNIVDWLQGSTFSVDFQTRSELSRKLATQAAKKKKKASKLEKVAEQCSEQTADVVAYTNQERLSSSSGVLSSSSRQSDNSNHQPAEEAVCCTPSQFIPIRKDWNTIGQRKLEGGWMKDQFIKQNQHLHTNPMDTTVQMVSDGDEEEQFFDAISDFDGTTSLTETRDKISRKSSPLSTVSEFIEAISVHETATQNTKTVDGSRSTRAVNTARVPPTVVHTKILQHSSHNTSLDNSFVSKKSTSPSAHPDINDIRHIAEQQETELRKEVCRRKSSSQSDSGKSTGTPVGLRSSNIRPATSMASSISVDFGSKLSPSVNSPAHISRLPVPVRKSVTSGHTLRQSPRSALSAAAIRGMAGGSTPSLIPPRHLINDDSRSECGANSRKDQRWTDECF